jgi:UDP-N-acetylmuramate: L-alanyl-gamma-D-glutamyl-meso-diaminopimelate ligase
MNSPSLEKFKSLEKGAHVHLMGICGTAMGSLAGLLKEQGYRVTGSDQNVYPPMSTQLEKMNIKVMEGYKKENLDPAPDFVVVGNVMTRKMEEVETLLNSSIPFTSLPSLLGELFLKNRESLVCCGTHGKTTTTSMAAWALESLDLHPGYLIGGVPLNFDYSFSARESDWFVIEGDEYDTAFFDKVPKFKHYHPNNAILTGVEFDHIDIYKDIDDVFDAFKILLDSIKRDDSVLVYNGDDQNIKKILLDHESSFWKLSYGMDPLNHACLMNEKITKEGTELLVRVGDREYEFFGAWHGTYNSLNFLAVLTLLNFRGLNIDKVIESASTFKGVKRRQQRLFENSLVTVFEDFAHHPTAVKYTIESFKKRYPDKKLIAVFEPRSATSRRSVFQKDYVNSFKLADKSVIAPVVAKSDKDTFSTKELAEDIRGQGGDSIAPASKQELLDSLIGSSQESCLVLFMSNGGFDNIPQDFVKKIDNNT